MKNTYAIMSGDDWEALYIDGKKVLEGHKLNTVSVLQKLGICMIYLEPREETYEFEGQTYTEDFYPDNLG